MLGNPNPAVMTSMSPLKCSSMAALIDRPNDWANTAMKVIRVTDSIRRGGGAGRALGVAPGVVAPEEAGHAEEPQGRTRWPR